MIQAQARFFLSTSVVPSRVETKNVLSRVTTWKGPQEGIQRPSIVTHWLVQHAEDPERAACQPPKFGLPNFQRSPQYCSVLAGFPKGSEGPAAPFVLPLLLRDLSDHLQLLGNSLHHDPQGKWTLHLACLSSSPRLWCLPDSMEFPCVVLPAYIPGDCLGSLRNYF